jgi:hypothetical protein
MPLKSTKYLLIINFVIYTLKHAKASNLYNLGYSIFIKSKKAEL